MTEPAARPRRQEQEPPADDITELAPGVLRSQLPVNMPGLGHVNCYFLEDERGVAVVDPGLPSKDSYAALTERLKRAGYPLERVHTVIVTHSHPDHFGGAGWLRAESGAEIVTHRSFRMMWDPTPDVDVEHAATLSADPDEKPLPHVRRFPWESTPWGGPGMDVPLQRKMWFRAARAFPRMRRLPVPTVRLDDAETISLARRDWIAVHTPGHTDDHLCLFDPTEGCMLCGDHVLPTITPHIGGLGTTHDPLGLFFESLDKVAAYGPQVTIALPAHGHPFSDLAGRAADIKEHHANRLEKLRATFDRARPPGDGDGDEHTPVLAARPRCDGRQRDLCPSRAPPSRRRDDAHQRRRRPHLRPVRLTPYVCVQQNLRTVE